MRWNGSKLSIALAAAFASVAACAAAGFGTVVPIGGRASDIVLDEARGVLYVANYTANRIDVLSTADNSVRTSMNVAPQPGALALSPDGRYLIIAHHGLGNDLNKGDDLVTIRNLQTSVSQTLKTGDTPLAVCFVADGHALIVTTAGFQLLDPASGALQVVDSFSNLATALPTPAGIGPSQILETAVAASADLMNVYGIADVNPQPGQWFFRYDVRLGRVTARTMGPVPKLLPRVSVAADGSKAMIGYAVFDSLGTVLAQYPGVVASAAATGNAIDSKQGIVYAQIPDANSPAGPPYAPAGNLTPATRLPVLSILDADNLTPRERIGIPENVVGKMVLSADGKALYAITDSGNSAPGGFAEPVPPRRRF
jgi:DNA-binding beta-propeller fold protein YncE